MGSPDNDIEKTKQAYSQIFDQYADNAPTTNEAILPRIEKFKDFLQDASSKKILDVGCAAGRETDELARQGLEVIGCDITPEFIERAKRTYPSYRFVVADMRHLPFENESFDGLWASASFLHIPKVEAAPTLAELVRVLRPAGVMYLSVMQGDFDGMRENKQMNWPERHFSDYQPEAMQQLLTDADLSVLFSDSTDTHWGPTFLHYYCKKFAK